MPHLAGPILRAFSAALLLGFAAWPGLPTAALAQGADAGTSAESAPPSAGSERASPPAVPRMPKDAAQALQDSTRARIKYLHDRLRITPAQEKLWAGVAQTMRDNAAAVAPLLRERLQSAEQGNAIDNLSSYEKLGAVQLDGLKKFLAAFATLYAGLSTDQKTIADAIFRIGPLSMAGNIPQLAEAIMAPEPNGPYPSYASFPPVFAPPLGSSYLLYPLYPYYYRYYGAGFWGVPPHLPLPRSGRHGLYHGHR